MTISHVTIRVIPYQVIQGISPIVSEFAYFGIAVNTYILLFWPVIFRRKTQDL